MKYPLRTEYETAVRNLDKFVFDSSLKQGQPIKDPKIPNLLRSHNGGKAIVYEIQTSSKKYALKCWVEDLGDLKLRYKAIDEYLRKINLPYFIDFSYNEQGILVNGQKYPIVKMEWIEGFSFKKFISNNINNPICIRDFAERFLEMMKVLHKNDVSHGDLQHGNIMVRSNGAICLIDYDSLYVPLLRNERDNIKGLPGYQHPNRNKLNKLSSKADYFSELVIYLSLLTISEKPSYWKDLEKEERLLFSEKDLADPRSSSIFAELTRLTPEIVYFALELEKFCRELDIESLQPLENLVDNYRGSKIGWKFSPIEISIGVQPTPKPIDLENTDWDIFTPNHTKPNSGNAQSSDPWDSLNSDPSSAWDKIGKDQSPPKAGKNNQPMQVNDDSAWNKFETIWNKFLKSVSSTWNKFKNWFS